MRGRPLLLWSAIVTAALAAILVLLLPAAAQAYFVDISITGGGRVYETTDANELDEHCPDAIEGFASPSTTPTGSLGASCRAGDASGDYGWNWVVRYVAEPAAGYRFDGWHSDGRTSPGPVICDGASGSSDYSGLACQFATPANLQVRARFVDDTAPQMSSLTGPNQVVNGSASFTFSAAADPTLLRFECRVAGVHEWQTCSSGHSENPATTGSYTLQVRAVDWSGNRSAESTWMWTVDKVAPETSLTLGPSSTVASTAAMFEFTSNESGSFECTLDGSAVACGSPKSYSGLGQGVHTFSVRARDVAGNYDPTPATRTWTVDTVAPETTLATSGPTGSTTATDATFTFSSDDAGATFRCQLDGQPVEGGCSFPRSYTGLAVGDHTFKVWAQDAAGNQDATPATRTWTVTPTGTGTGDGGGGAGGTAGGGTAGGGTAGDGAGGGDGAAAGPTLVQVAAALKADIAAAVRRLQRMSLAKLRRKRRFVVRLRSLGPGRFTLKLAGKARRGSRAARSTMIAKGTRKVTAGGRHKLVLRLTKKGRRALRRAGRLRGKLTVRFVDSAGRAVVRSKRITLKRR